MIVLRPADCAEAITAWQIAMQNPRPTALIFSRQNVKDLPACNGDRRKEAQQANRGGYIVRDCAGKADVVLLGNGSDVGTLVEGAALLETDGIKVRVVSVPSEGLFRDQPKEYQESVLPVGIPRYGMTSGLSVNLERLVGENGYIHGMNHFGYSAPYKVLEEKFGFCGQQVYEEVKKMLGK